MKPKICKECKKIFIPESNRQVYCKGIHLRRCPRCGKMYEERYTENLKFPPRTCSKSCTRNMEEVIKNVPILYRNDKYVVVDSRSPRPKYANRIISSKFNEQKLQCIHVFPQDNLERIMSKIQTQNKIHADELELYKLNEDYTKEFLYYNDIYKPPSKLTLSIGLVRGKEIYQVMSFCEPRYSKDYPYEIIRCCTKIGYTVVGGWDKISSSASLDFGISNCISYKDNSKNIDSNLFQSIGMKLHHVNPPRKRCGVHDCGVTVFTYC